MKIVNFLLDKVIAPLLVILFTPLVIGILSKIKTDDWLEWFRRIPIKIWIITWISFSVWLIIILGYRRFKKLRQLDYSEELSLVGNIPIFGWKNVGELPFKEVLWKIIVPAPEPWEFSFKLSDISESDIEINTPPLCPNCKTEIEQNHSFWGGYIWNCVKCDFKKRNRYSYHKEANRVRKIAKADFEKYKQEIKKK